MGYALLAPSLFGVVTFLLLPMLVVAWLSVHRWDLLGPIQYVGLDNWRSVLTDRSFATSLVVTALFILIVVPTQSVLGLIAAAMLARGLPGSGFFRTPYLLPWICAPLAIAVLWRWILAPTDGAVSTLQGERIEWLTDPDLALPVVSAVTIWTNVGYVTLFFLAGILAIPADIQDAARTDGANAWQRFHRITLPMLRPTLFFVLVTGGHQRGASVRHRLRTHRRRAAGPHRPDRASHLRRGVRRGRGRAGGGDGGCALRSAGRSDDRPAFLLPPADHV